MDQIEADLVRACLHAIQNKERVKELITLLNADAVRSRSEQKFILHNDPDLWYVDYERWNNGHCP